MTKKEFSYKEMVKTGDATPYGDDGLSVEVTNDSIIIEADDGGPLKRIYLSAEEFAQAVSIVGRARIARLVATGDPAATENPHV